MSNPLNTVAVVLNFNSIMQSSENYPTRYSPIELKCKYPIPSWSIERLPIRPIGSNCIAFDTYSHAWDKHEGTQPLHGSANFDLKLLPQNTEICLQFEVLDCRDTSVSAQRCEQWLRVSPCCQSGPNFETTSIRGEKRVE